jgi:threonine dehydratase
VIHPRAITEFIYRFNDPSVAHIFVSFKMESSDRTKEVESVLRTLEEKGMKGYDISDDEMSKSHARYMIGGCRDVKHERVFRFGALFLFLFLFRFTC